MLKPRIPFHHHYKIIFNWQVAIIVAKFVDAAFQRGVSVGVVFEIKSFVVEFCFADLGFAFGRNNAV